MKRLEFDSVGSHTGLGGWFDGFCPSNGIADKAIKARKSVEAETAEWQKKYNLLKSGTQANEWADLKSEVARTEKEIQAEKQKLSQENAIADALGIGLGAFCNGAVSRRKKAEAALRDAEKSLGVIKGSYQTLEKQQREGIAKASQVIEQNNATIESLRKQVEAVKVKIANYKAQRDAEKQALANENAAADSSVKINKASFLSKDNLPLVIGAALLTGGIIYAVKVKKGKKTVKKITV